MSPEISRAYFMGILAGIMVGFVGAIVLIIVTGGMK